MIKNASAVNASLQYNLSVSEAKKETRANTSPWLAPISCRRACLQSRWRFVDA